MPKPAGAETSINVDTAPRPSRCAAGRLCAEAVRAFDALPVALQQSTVPRSSAPAPLVAVAFGILAVYLYRTLRVAPSDKGVLGVPGQGPLAAR